MNLKKKLFLGGAAAVAFGIGLLAKTFTDAGPLTGAAVGGGNTHSVGGHIIFDVDHNWQAMGLSAESLANGALFGQAVTLNGGDPGLIRLNGDQIRYQESDEGAHDNAEVANVIALIGNPLELGIDGEVGTLSHAVTGHGMRVTLNFQRTYENPVLFLQVNSNVGTMPLSVYGTTVSSSWAYIKFFEPAFHDGTHLAETIHYAVIDAGTYDLPDGRRLVVGKQTITTNSSSDFDEISLGGLFVGSPALVTSLQWNSNHKYLGTRLEKVEGTDGIQGFKVRVMGQAGGDPPAGINATVGYMALGQPFNVADKGRLKLTASDGRVLGLAPDMHTNGHCYNLSDEGFDNQIVSAAFTSNDTTTFVVAYEDAYCSGNKVSALANDLVPNGTLDMSSIQASSVRVMTVTGTGLWSSEEKCVSQGEILLQNEVLSLIFQSDGNLALYLSNPAADSIALLWQTGTSLDSDPSHKACFDDGQLVVREHGTTAVFSAGTAGRPYTKLLLTGDCDVVISDYIWASNTSWGIIDWYAGTDGCVADMGAAQAQGMPEFSFAQADVDHDGVNELTLVVSNDDGSGYLMFDPLGMADFAYNTLGYPITDDYFDALSPTQQAGLLSQVSTYGVGDDVSGEEMEAIVEDLEEDDEENKRAYYTLQYQGSVTENGLSGYLVGDSNQTRHDGETYYSAVQLGQTYVLAKYDGAYAWGVGVEATFVSLTVGVDGKASVELTAVTYSAALIVDRNHFVIGESADLIAVSFVAGDEDGSYAGLTAGVGAGFWLEAKTGRNDQYGVTIQVPVIPVGVALYVKGAHLEVAGAWMRGAMATAGNSVAGVAESAWNSASSWAVSASGDVVVAVENTADELATAFYKAGDQAGVMAATAGNAIHTSLEATTEAMSEAVAAISKSVEFMADGLGTAGEAVTAAAEEVGQWAEEASDAVDSVVEDVEETSEEIIDAAEDLVEDAKKGICKIFGC